MRSNMLSVPFDFLKSPPRRPPAVALRADTVVRSLRELGFERIRLLDVPVAPANGGELKRQRVVLWIENDAMYLAESYLYLEEIVASGLPKGKHSTYLDDGVFLLQAEILLSNVLLRIIHRPGLEQRSWSVTEIRMPLADYLNTWRKLAKALHTGVGAAA
jgi:hypothetical protein